LANVTAVACPHRQQDLGEVGILEQELVGSQPDDRIRNLVDDLGQRAPWLDVGLPAGDGERLLSDTKAPLCSRRLLEPKNIATRNDNTSSEGVCGMPRDPGR
jgi:hypothetical protein